LKAQIFKKVNWWW